MELRLVIDDRKLMVISSILIAVSLVGLTVAYGGNSPSAMGHTWGEMECVGCIITGNLADSSVNGNKVIDGSIASADIADGSIVTADVGSIDGSKITGSVDMLDGLHADGLVRWGNPCNPVWGSCAAAGCCSPGTETCNYMGRELIVRGTTACITLTTSQGTCGTRSCYTNTCCGGA